MKKFLLSASLLLISATSWAAPELQKPAPDFTAQGSDGKTYKLSDLKGQHVVLEWWNKDCPYVRKHYDSGNMQALQQQYAKADDKKEKPKVLWLTVLSSAPGKQGHVSAAEANRLMADAKASPTTVLLDPKGDVGRAYEAKTTPHMFVIDPKGTLVYMGAIDDKPRTDKAEIATAKNYVREALDASLAGKRIEVASSKPYGCSVKY
jgi:peroxiredoxin